MENKQLPTYFLRKWNKEQYIDKQNVQSSILNNIYFFLYESTYDEEGIIHQNMFLHIFIKFLKSPHNLLYKLFHKDIEEQSSILKDFILQQIKVNKLDILYDTEKKLSLIKQNYVNKLSTFLHETLDYDIIEKNIITTAYREILEFNNRNKDFKQNKQSDDRYINNVHLVIEETFNTTIECIKAIKIDNIDSDLIYNNDFIIQKNIIIENLKILKDLNLSIFLNPAKIIKLNDLKYHSNFLIYENEIKLEHNVTIFKKLYESMMFAFKTELLFKCFAKPLARKRLKSRIDSKKEKFIKRKDYYRLFNNLISNTSGNISYIPIIILSHELSLDENISYNLANSYNKAKTSKTNNTIKRDEYVKNFRKFTDLIYNRKNIENRTTNLNKDKLEFFKHKSISVNQLEDSMNKEGIDFNVEDLKIEFFNFKKIYLDVYGLNDLNDSVDSFKTSRSECFISIDQINDVT